MRIFGTKGGELGSARNSSPLSEIYISARRNERNLFDLSNYSFAGDITDEQVIKRFGEVHTASTQTKSLREVVSEIAKKNGWSASDEETLANSSPDDYYKLFKSETGEHLSRYVNACLQFGRISNATERQKRIGEAATVALKRIGRTVFQDHCARRARDQQTELWARMEGTEQPFDGSRSVLGSLRAPQATASV